MPPPSEWLAWEFWAKDSLGLYHLFLIVGGVVGGVVGLLLLTVRTFATHRLAQAAVNQAKTAADRHEEQTNTDRARRITENFAKWVSITVRLRRRVGLLLGDEDGRRFSRRDGVGLSWRYRGGARRRG